MNKESQLPPLTETQLDVLRRFAWLDARIAELRQTLTGMFEFHLELQPLGSILQRRSASGRFRLPEPGIVITREHIQNALDRRRFELISERDLAEWATILLINDAYVLDPADEDLIADVHAARNESERSDAAAVADAGPLLDLDHGGNVAIDADAIAVDVGLLGMPDLVAHLHERAVLRTGRARVL